MDTDSRPGRGSVARRQAWAPLGTVLAALAAALLLTAGPAAATGAGAGAAPAGSSQAPAGPQLSIAIDNGRTSTSAGDTPTYTITVRNLGTTDVDGLEVTQSVPPGLRFESADPAATAQTGSVGWTLDLKAAGAATFHTTMTVLQTPAELLRLATVACARTSADGPPIVCASHSDQLPAGANAQAGRAASGPAAPSPGPNRWYLAGGAVLAVAALALAALMLRRRGPFRAGGPRRSPA
jgi:uncharacterized repeat protein (TIGR01451 family)